jgi:mannitol 2-dehydrogenase
VVDRIAPVLAEYARRERDEPNAFISQELLFGDLARNERFVSEYQSALASLRKRGARATLESLA